MEPLPMLNRMYMKIVVLAAILTLSRGASAQSDKPYLFRQPTVSKTQIVFCYAGDLWSVPRAGGEAVRLTAAPGGASGPRFSPDGSQIAFTGQYDGNTDVYVMAAGGGVPKRLTWHPGRDEVVGWTNDGRRVIVASARESANDYIRLFTVSVEGGMPDSIPLPAATQGSLSPDGAKMAYVPNPKWQEAWKRYRGGQTTPIWIANLADSKIEKLPRDNSNDFAPMWVGSKIYFLSDRAGPVTLFAYDTGSKRVSQVIKNDGLDIKSASAGAGAIAYEQFGTLHLFDTATGKSQPVNVRIAGDLREVRPHFVKASKFIRKANLSPTGARAVFESRGEVISAPADKGDVRNLTNTPGVAERDPAWSPDGQRIAYFSDESGDYALHIRAQNGMGEVKKILLGEASFFYSPVWSPDGKKIAYTDKRLNLWYVSVDGGAPVKVDTNSYDEGDYIQPKWSPDSKWITYARQLRNMMGAIFLYSLDTGKATQVTDGLSDAQHPVFDRSGKYLYFTASTDIGLTIMGLDMSSDARPVTRSVYLVVLRNDLPSPLAPESDEEKAAEEKKEAAGAKPAADTATRIDLERIGQRILSLPIPARNFQELYAGKTGFLFLREAPVVQLRGVPPGFTITKFDLNKRKVDPYLTGAQVFEVSSNGEKTLYKQGTTWAITSAEAVKPGDGVLKLDDAEVRVDPRAEWRQMYREVWRIERDFFYDPGFHGLDLPATERKYAAYLDNLGSRDDLNYLFEEMLGEITVGHMFVSGGDMPEAPEVPGGLLGADYKIENGRYRFARIYNGENWNPGTRAPLTEPGVDVKTGDYLLAVNGRDVPATDEVFRFFEATAGKQTVLRVGPNADGTGARDVTVVPVPSETGLRHLAWVEDNRRLVDKLTGGRVAYMHLPDTGMGGFTSFNRNYFSQTDRQGAIIDERFNHGGQLADYIVDYLGRKLMSRVVTREGLGWNSPMGAIYGPKVMIVNEMAGSGGDALPWYFHKAGVGTIVGKRTWGGLVGIGGYPPLVDGGGVTAPRMAIYGLNGEWEIENHGMSPDVEVDLDPAAWRAGHDTQLEKAIEVINEQLKKPQPTYKVPAYPNYHKK